MGASPARPYNLRYLVKVGTDDNLSDIFTKILGPNKFESLRDRMIDGCLQYADP